LKIIGVCNQAKSNHTSYFFIFNTGHAKLMTSYYLLEKLRKIPDLKNAKYLNPYLGSKGNSIRYLSVVPGDL